MQINTDLFVIGAGSGGVRAARIAASYGATVMIAEESRVGGTCVIRGCVPKKLMVYASRMAEEIFDAKPYGWNISPTSFDLGRLIENKNREITRLEAAYRSTLERNNVSQVNSRAVLVDGNTVRLEATSETVRAKKILIAVGGRPHVPAEIEGAEHAITSDDALDLKEVPKRLLIHGGGYIAVEFACIFAALGSKVTLICRSDNILRGFDDEIRAHLAAEMAARGIEILTSQNLSRIEQSNCEYVVILSSGSTLIVDKVMSATGRRPYLDGLGLQRAGVAVSSSGGVAVDKHFKTTAEHIYAVGDVTNRINLTPVAIREGHAFADTEFGGKPTSVDYENIPTAVFSTPELGTVGCTEKEAVERYASVDIYKAKFRPMKATVAGRGTQSFYKLIVESATDIVRGCHIVGPEAGEQIQLVGIAMKMGATKADFDSVMAVHPTAAEELVTMRTKTVSLAQQPVLA